jgi:hypothetical protein
MFGLVFAWAIEAKRRQRSMRQENFMPMSIPTAEGIVK